VDLLIDATSYYVKNGDIDVEDIFGGTFNDVEIFYSTPARYTKCKNAEFLASRQSNVPSAREFTNQAAQENIAETNKEPVNWSIKTGDFFPYADCDHCYWTGYFTSRQGLKRLERVGSSFLHAARQIHSIKQLQSADFEPYKRLKSNSQVDSELIPVLRTWNESPLYELEDAMGVAQHHDAVAGMLTNDPIFSQLALISRGLKLTLLVL
jgi:hypothetical protein